MNYKQPMKTSQIKRTVLKAVAEWLDEQLPDDGGDCLGFQDEALEAANEAYEEALDSGDTTARAKAAAKTRFFEELESLIGDNLIDGIAGCFDKCND